MMIQGELKAVFAVAVLFTNAAFAINANAATNQKHSVNHKHSAKEHQLCEGFAPKNDLRIPVGMESQGGLDEAAFNRAIDKVSAVFAPIVAAKGGRLLMDKQWSNDEVNAQASRQGTTWKVAMWGGLGRHPLMTEDGMSLVVCHELGHHIGGAPKVRSIFGTSWASNEGQSDYFATLKCARKIFRSENNIALVSNMSIPSIVSNQCQTSLQAMQSDPDYANEFALCQRSAMAGLALGTVLGSLGRTVVVPEFEKTDTSVVTTTYDGHPQAQCRLDTYFAGATCTAKDSADVSDSNVRAGTCNEGAEAFGFRSKCWYKAPTARRLARR